MQFSTTLTALTALVLAAAEPQNAGTGNLPANRCNVRAVTGNQVVKGTAPIWNDCYHLADQFQKGNFFAKNMKVTHHYQRKYKTCGFSITGKEGNFMLGKDDVADLIRSTAVDLGAKSGAYQTGLVPCDEPGTASGSSGRKTGWTIGNLDAPGPKKG